MRKIDWSELKFLHGIKERKDEKNERKEKKIKISGIAVGVCNDIFIHPDYSLCRK
jgi:hypothetical protein